MDIGMDIQRPCPFLSLPPVRLLDMSSEMYCRIVQKLRVASSHTHLPRVENRTPSASGALLPTRTLEFLFPRKHNYQVYVSRIQMDIQHTSQFVSLNANDMEIVDIDTLATDGFPSSSDFCAPQEETFPKPFVGMEFESLQKAYFFYNEYARSVGFSIRRAKNRRSNIDGELLFQRFCCSKEGHRRKRNENDDGTKIKDGILVKVRRRNVKSIRVGCSAKLDVKRTTHGRWVVQKFDEEHNHDYANQGEKHLLRSQRRQQGDTTDMRSSRGLNYFSGEDGSRERKIFERGDVKVILEYFTKMKVDNPSFFYAVEITKDDQMLNFFWADARSRMDFGYFGDVIYFSTSYGCNSYGRPFAPIFGVNHHLQTVLFGCVILLNETEDSFTWLFETFLKAMSGHRPFAIITDHNEAMEKAIERVLPGTQHYLCPWHIFQDAATNLSEVLNSKGNFITDFTKCVYEPVWCEDFESRWEFLLDRYEISDNEWLIDMFKKRQKWAPVYSRHIFKADMTTTQRIENMNSFFEGYLNESLPLNEFLKHFEKTVAYRREEEINEDARSTHTRPVLKLDVPMEQQAAEIYTGSAFKEFHKEFCESFSYIAEETARVGTNWTFSVSRWGQNGSCCVNLNSCDNDIQVICDCQHYEFTGFLCRHIFKVFTVRNIMLIPMVYFKRRWTKKAKYGLVMCDGSKEVQADSQSSVKLRYTDLCQLAFNYCNKAAVSVDAYQTAKHDMEIMLRELEKISEEDMPITQPDIEHIRNLHFPSEVVSDIGVSEHLTGGDNHMLSSATHATMQNLPGAGDKRTGYWLRL